jgi:hypothetical protein
MPKINYTDQQLLDFSEEHLMYELNILQWLADAISKTEKGFQLSAYLESFAVHLRGLIDFLYTDPKNAREDDLVAADFFGSPATWSPGELSATLDKARKRMNKEVGHITYQRKTGMHPDKPWPISALFKEILPVLRKFATEASGKKLHAKVLAWAITDDAKILTLAVSASTSASNTAVVAVVGTSFPPTGTK